MLSDVFALKDKVVYKAVTILINVPNEKAETPTDTLQSLIRMGWHPLPLQSLGIAWRAPAKSYTAIEHKEDRVSIAIKTKKRSLL